MAKNKDSDKKTEKKPEDKVEKEMRWIFFILIAAAVCFFAFFIIKENFLAVTWNGYTFHKTTMGGEKVFVTNITLVNNGQPATIELYLRNNPNELEKIPVNISGAVYKNGAVTLSPEIANCSNTDKRASVWILSQFLAYRGVQSLDYGITEPSNADPALFANLSIKNCSDALGKTVFLLKQSESNESKIYRDKTFNNCIVMEYSNCEAMKIVESYILHDIANMKNSSGK